MAARDLPTRAASPLALPVFERLAPALPSDCLAERILAATEPDDVVVDLFGRGGWVARAALAIGRRALSVETAPLTRLLADVVVRPPDLRHLDAAFQAVAAAPHGTTSLRAWVHERFGTRCPTCGRTVPLEELVWETPSGGRRRGRRQPRPPDSAIRPTRRALRCAACLDRRGRGSELRHARPEPADVELAAAGEPEIEAVREALRRRFPVPGPGHDGLVDAILGLHSERQLVALHAILERIEGDLRASQVTSALRLAFLHALLPASRLNAYPGRAGSIRIAGGALRPPASLGWRERNPWLALEEGYQLVRGFVQALDDGPLGAVQARLAEPLIGVLDGPPMISLRVASPAANRRLADEGDALDAAARKRVTLVLGQLPVEWTPGRLSEAYAATAWTLGHEAAALLPLGALFARSVVAEVAHRDGSVHARTGGAEPAADTAPAEDTGPAVTGPPAAAPFAADTGPTRSGPAVAAPSPADVAPAASGPAADVQPAGTGPADTEPAGGPVVIRSGLQVAARLLGPKGHATILLDGDGPAGLFGAGLAAAAAGWRVSAAHLAEPGQRPGGWLDLVPPGGVLGPGPRTRANRPLRPFPGGAGDPGVVRGSGRLTGPEPIDGRYSPSTAARVVVETVVEILQARGEPAPRERLLGEILVGLDRSGQLRRYAAAAARQEAGALSPAAAAGEPSSPGTSPASAAAGLPGPIPDPGPSDASVVALLELVDGELTRPDGRRLQEVEPGRIWLADPADAADAAAPLSDRVEWAVFSLLGTGGELSERDVRARLAGMFGGHDAPDPWLVDACLASYGMPGPTPDRLVGRDELQARAAGHAGTIALLADLGHRMGLGVTIAPREQVRRARGRLLVDWLDGEERHATLAFLGSGGPRVVEEVDCTWFVRPRFAFLFEVEWTAMLGESIIRRGRLVGPDERVVRFLVTVPERVELIRAKLARAPILRGAMEQGNWHVLRTDSLRRFAALEAPSLAVLEPYLGLDPLVEGPGVQMPLFEA